MDHANVLKGSPFRTAVYATAAVVVTLAVMGAVAFVFVRQTLESEIERQIGAEQVMLQEIYDKGGEAALIRTIAEINNPVALSRRAIGAFGPDGLKLAGNIAAAPPAARFQRTTLAVAGASGGETRAYYVHVTALNDLQLVIGHDLSLIAATERRLIVALAVSGLVAGLVILLIGYAASHESLRKLRALETTLDRVSRGDDAARVPVQGDGDQIDRIARRVNAHLDRLSGLMTTTRATAAAIAHDLKTPLSRAQLALQSARGLIENGRDAQDSLERIETELARLSAIFDTVLRIARIETDSGSGTRERFDLPPVLADLFETFAPVAEERGQTLVLHQSGDALPPVRGDARMIRQMVANLIQNAISHSGPGNRTEIAARGHDGACVLEIADRGPGIPEAERARVFDLFYRGNESRTGGGNGLGLALVRAIAERHAIAITLSDNAPGLRVTLGFPAVG
ncbi:MAG: hypothetical protein KDK02_15000 [Rhodobacteraceae bacterium]|nr:hypothetical protein [Paracoccaceae bacterium]